MMEVELCYRGMSRDRVHTALQRLDAAYHLATGTVYADRALWDKLPAGTIVPVTPVI